MSLWDSRTMEAARSAATDFIEQLGADAAELMWDSESGRTPPGFTVMNDEEEQLFLEEMTILAMQNGEAGDTGKGVVEHPVVDERIGELEAKARKAQGTVTEEDEFLAQNGRGI